MNKPIVYDRMDKTYHGFGVAILENATEVKITQEINGIYMLDLVLPRNDEKWQYIQEENYIKVDGELFIIRTMDEVRDEQGRLTSNIQCEHIFFEMLDDYIIYRELINVTAQEAADTFVEGTRFKVDASRIPGRYDFEVEDATPIAGLKQILDHFQCEYVCADRPDPDGKFLITLYPQIGADNGVQFRYRKNLKSIRKRTDSRGVITRLYVYGKDGLGIEAVNGGKSYLDSAEIGKYARPKQGSITLNDITDPQELLEAGQQHLATVDKPKVSYEGNVMELAPLEGYGNVEKFGLGDVVRVIEENLDTDIKARIMKYERYPYEPWRSRVTIANFIPGLENILADLEDAKRVVNNVTYKGKINTYWLDGIINTLQNQLRASGSYAQVKVIENAGFLLENTDANSPDYGALYLGPGIFALANDKDASGWRWRTFGTGRGFTADEINAGILNASLVRIISEDGLTFIDGLGLTATRADGKSRTRLNSSEGIRIQKGGTSWVDQFYTDTDGNLILAGMFIRGSGNNVFKATDQGIQLGHDNFGSAPFRVDMQGNAYLNKLFANSAQIQDSQFNGGAIIGSSINIGNGVFTVNPQGIMSAMGANISGNIVMTGGSISWANVNSDPVATSAQALAANAQTIAQQIVAGSYKGGTFIDEKNIMSPKIYTGYLYGGTVEGGSIISNSSINVTTDINLGNNIFMRGSASAQSITASGIGNITFDRNTDAIILAANNGVFVSENKFYIGGLNVVDKLNSLDSGKQPAGYYVRAGSFQDIRLQYMSGDNTLEVWVGGAFVGDIQLV